MRPRWPWVTGSTKLVALHLVIVCFAAGLLMLPIIGVPFTNTLPALVIIVGILGVLERDGLAVVVSYILFIATMVYFAASAALIIEVLERVWHWLGGT